jgi:hypothetical protein
VPVATTVNVTLLPLAATWLVGWVLIPGAVPPWVFGTKTSIARIIKPKNVIRVTMLVGVENPE